MGCQTYGEAEGGFAGPVGELVVFRNGLRISARFMRRGEFSGSCSGGANERSNVTLGHEL